MNNPVDIILASAKGELRNLEYDDNYLIKLSVNNSRVVERLIDEDPNYHFNASKENFLQLWERRNHQLSLEDCYNVVKNIAIENNTRTADRFCRLFANYIYTTEGFFNRVIDGDLTLVDSMLKYVTDHGGRRDKSLSSKICKYLNEWICNGNHYSINDSFVRMVLPYYLKQYHIDERLWKNKNFEKMKYVTIINLISKLEESVHSLNKNQIDHILWYGYRSDPIRCTIAAQLALQ